MSQKSGVPVTSADATELVVPASAVEFAFGAGVGRKTAVASTELVAKLAEDQAFAVIHRDYKVVNLSEYLPEPAAPERKAGEIELHHPASFIDYVNDHKDADSLITADITEARLTAVLNFHKKDGAPRYGDHKAIYRARFTPEWVRWVEFCSKGRGQVEFARFIEENIPDIGAPEGALLLEMAEDMTVKKDVEFKSGHRLKNGQTTLSYRETISETTSNGDMKIPDTIVLMLAPFDGGKTVNVEAKVRYRIESQKLVLQLEMLRVTRIVQDAFNEIVAGIQKGVENVRLVHGKILS